MFASVEKGHLADVDNGACVCSGERARAGETLRRMIVRMVDKRVKITYSMCRIVVRTSQRLFFAVRTVRSYFIATDTERSSGLHGNLRLEEALSR
jgi:hypothetical protein